MFSYFCLTFLLVLGWILSASLTYFVPSRTFFLAPISSVYMETIGSSRSGILAQSSSLPTWTCQVHPPLPGGSSSGHWLRYNDQVHRRKVGKQEKRAWNLPGVASAKSLGSKLFLLLHILLLAVRILWDKEEIRCCQGETWKRCERNHRTDSGLLLNLKCTCKLVNFYAHSSPGERRCIHRLPRCLCVEVQPCTFSFQVCIFAKVKDCARTNFFSLIH